MSNEEPNIQILLDVELPIIVRFGTHQMSLDEVIKIGPGTMIELDRAADEGVELFVNSKLFARGDVVAFDGHYGVKITEIISPVERVQSLA